MEHVPLWQHFIFASIATCGFAIFFNIQLKLLFYDGIVGGIGWMVYYLLSFKYDNPFIYSFAAAAVVSICSELLARKLKQPAIIIVIPGILPLIPGIGLYNTLYYIMQKEYFEAATTGTRTFIISVGIALGILVVSSLSRVFNLYQLKKAFIKNDSLKYVNWVNYGKNRTSTTFILNRKEMNDNLNSMNIDVSLKERENLEKLERSNTEDYAIDIDTSIDTSTKKSSDNVKIVEEDKQEIKVDKNNQEKK
ncbi:threonine/serine exporter family protein [Peptostreptococcus canis]|uniref:Threonine/serine exporter family protein n=1 Tax=Peptostreptococcus canis TaxID=1159213 RepID=A0ABR6TKK6_9FIRM|nr:threonine/serine exporter family protein [Peptostreptococcus canis]MBC2575937.1 threonine/serine exporter family protein [Peptostreptococcus canis]MBP1997942.1 uncharacterized membrane protein YjjB (DUF3815 family) [Peptostreptococcus canis]